MKGFCTQVAYNQYLQAIFVELPAFERHRTEYLDDDEFRALQAALMKQPTAGDVIKDTGGLRKLRFAGARRGKGKSGGLRIIYYWRVSASLFWLFTLYDKDEAGDLNAKQRAQLKALLERELKARRPS